MGRGFLLVALCVGLSHGICHNGICDTDRCTDDDYCPSCFSCDTACGTCKTIPNCCMSHQVCPDWDGTCDAEVDPTTCNYCDSDVALCKPGCVDNSNCEAGSPLATSASQWMFALTTRTATTDFQTSVTSKTPRTPLASTVRAENANQHASLMPIALVDTLARITSATILLGRFSSSRSRSEHKPAAPIAQRRESQ